VFRRTTTQFLPTLAGPVPVDYKLGPGDHLVLILTGDVEHAYSLQVSREGFVLIPQVGEVFVANLTLGQLRDVLYARLGRVYSGVKRGDDAGTRFDVAVASVRVNQVYVVGEVKQPGAYQISALGTVLTSLYAAGGITNRADLREIEVRRLNEQVATVDLYDYLLRGDKRSDVRLETGDVVFVPLHGRRAQITGAVLRPAIYELKPGENLVDLVRAAGGFRADAALRRISIYRILPAAERGPGPFPRAVVDVPLPRAGGNADPPGLSVVEFSGVLVSSIGLEDADSVAVDSLPPLAGTLHVAISGMVNKPGRYPWRNGMTLRDLVLLARGPKVGAYLNQAEVARMPADRSQGQLAQTIRVAMDSTYLFERDSSGHYFGAAGPALLASGAPEVPLAPYDNVLILQQPNFQLQRTVYLGGEVRFAGAYALTSKDERLADLIDRAGGLTPQAYAEGIGFFRAANSVGRIDVEVQRALSERTSRYNIVLQAGDSIEIPAFQPSVKVSGAVNSPGSVLWQRGKGLDYYLSAAGGPTYKADDGHINVRYANGQVRTRHHILFFASDPTPGPGSEVMVPRRDPTQVSSWVPFASALAQIFASALTIAVLAKQL
jgi:protein involved in polysaccharide export with SLBB domain